ncbi:hypothetical protein O9G_006326 [Rozella allomycis CSF55]|uniref:Mitochondrial outer membrane transport complex Sam37/metaxin N-terminal domain-containing protein n=2 Tax=Rozella allomycis (strain CSF55) TaxID=988480 RepID=A0A075AMP8_ROZAC|nr:hypothetical protein O9G_006326 [Rozella allomycis CSF55]|eukprot:EPZ30936.1 hypothetical protein O9G_006326 [Rozella allomycis CSF55]
MQKVVDSFLQVTTSGFLLPISISNALNFEKNATSYSLIIHPPAYGCPSLDIPCIQVSAYLKFLNCKIPIEYSNEPLISPTNELPCLLSNYGHAVGGLENVCKELEYIAGKEINFRLSDEQRAQCMAYESLISRLLEIIVVLTCSK